MKKLETLGDKIIVLPISTDSVVEKGDIVVLEGKLKKGTVVEFPKSYADVYKKGDVVLFGENVGVSHFYKGDTHLFLNGGGAPIGDVWAIETDDE